ncbi:hypothetical protein Tco_0612059, partial [Tanacetum coccineum]
MTLWEARFMYLHQASTPVPNVLSLETEPTGPSTVSPGSTTVPTNSSIP